MVIAGIEQQIDDCRSQVDLVGLHDQLGAVAPQDEILAALEERSFVQRDQAGIDVGG